VRFFGRLLQQVFHSAETGDMLISDAKRLLQLSFCQETRASSASPSDSGDGVDFTLLSVSDTKAMAMWNRLCAVGCFENYGVLVSEQNTLEALPFDLHAIDICAGCGIARLGCGSRRIAMPAVCWLRAAPTLRPSTSARRCLTCGFSCGRARARPAPLQLLAAQSQRRRAAAAEDGADGAASDVSAEDSFDTGEDCEALGEGEEGTSELFLLCDACYRGKDRQMHVLGVSSLGSSDPAYVHAFVGAALLDPLAL